MSLNPQQFKFTRMVALLILFAYEQGYTLSFSDAFARDGHKPDSFHYRCLAVDFNLFQDGEFLTQTEDYRELGEFWESLGGSWGGQWNDGNHYSYTE